MSTEKLTEEQGENVPPTEKLTGVSLFTGCGGSDLGAKRAGINIVFSNDNYPPAIKTYNKYKSLLASEDTDVHGGDIRDITSFPACDILIGCYPCQSFTMGGPREPESDERTILYKEFLRCLKETRPKYFIVENVAGMELLEGGKYLYEQIKAFSEARNGYSVSFKCLDAKDYGVPADRRRIFLVGVRRDIGAFYWFPKPTHGPFSETKTIYASHGEALRHLPLDCPGEVYHPEKDRFSWWFMSRNRKRLWSLPAYTVVSNWRHVTLHPASPTMRLVSSDWKNGSKQVWEFTDEHEHLTADPQRPTLDHPRRLSWRECGVLQTFPAEMEPEGPVKAKYLQIGNAVPPLLMEHIARGITSGASLKDIAPPYLVSKNNYEEKLASIVASVQEREKLTSIQGENI